MGQFFLQLGGWGLVLLGIADGLLFAPFGLDVLLIVLSARHPDRIVWYVLAAAVGSIIGYAIIDALARKGGEEGLRKKMDEQKFERLRKKMEKNAGMAVALAALMPPPFPFTAVLAGAAAFQYPRQKLLMILAGARCARYVAFALLAAHFGRRVLRVIESPGFRWFVIALVAISIIGSAITIVKWVRQRPGRTASAAAV